MVTIYTGGEEIRTNAPLPAGIRLGYAPINVPLGMYWRATHEPEPKR
jgi:hypothetical protein